MKTYREARARAQERANETGRSFGLEHNSLFGEWRVFMLPNPKNRFGHERRCEVVDLDHVAPGAAG